MAKFSPYYGNLNMTKGTFVENTFTEAMGGLGMRVINHGWEHTHSNACHEYKNKRNIIFDDRTLAYMQRLRCLPDKILEMKDGESFQYYPVEFKGRTKEDLETLLTVNQSLEELKKIQQVEPQTLIYYLVFIDLQIHVIDCSRTLAVEDQFACWNRPWVVIPGLENQEDYENWRRKYFCGPFYNFRSFLNRSIPSIN